MGRVWRHARAVLKCCSTSGVCPPSLPSPNLCESMQPAGPAQCGARSSGHIRESSSEEITVQDTFDSPAVCDLHRVSFSASRNGLECVALRLRYSWSSPGATGGIEFCMYICVCCISNYAPAVKVPHAHTLNIYTHTHTHTHTYRHLRV